MNRIGLCCTLVLIISGSLQAQNTLPPAAAPVPMATPMPTPMAPPAAGPLSRLDVLLQAWEQRMTGTATLFTECTRTEINKTFNTTEVFVGQARYMKPNLAKLDLAKQGEPGNFEKYVCTGTFLYEYRPKNKLVRVHELPKGNGNAVADNASMSFIFGMKAEEAKQRFTLTLRKEDAYWIYLDILPKYPSDKQEFTKAQMVFYAQPGTVAMLPRRLWFEHPNGDEIQWEFPKIETNVKLERTEFVAPPAPMGWQVMRADQQAPKAPAQPANPTQGPQGRSVMPMGEARPTSGGPRPQN